MCQAMPQLIGVKRYYQWVNHGEKNCPTCDRMEGEIKSEEQWDAGLSPGFHKGCDCTLDLVSEETIDELHDDAYDVLLHIARRKRMKLTGLAGIIAGNPAGLRPRATPLKPDYPGQNLPKYERFR